MDELKHLINEALAHNPTHPGFKTNRASYSFEDDPISSKVKGEKLATEHRHLSKLHSLNDLPERVASKIDKAVHAYTGPDSSAINRYLIHKGTTRSSYNKAEKYHLEYIKTLNEHIDSAKPLDQEHHVYSGLGVGFNPEVVFKRAKGIIKTKAFTSTSLHPEVAASFANTDSYDEHHILHFHLPVGYNKGVYLGDRSQLPYEKEMLLKPDQKWKLTNHSTVEFSKKQWDYGRQAFKTRLIKRHIWTVVPHED